MLDLHTPADQRQASSEKWHMIAIAEAILGLQVLCFANLLMQYSCQPLAHKLICAVGRQSG